ncbi:MAG: polysaccharide biosynthesis protein [Bacteroidales bacterium]|nr:polysaccharide biosynthesis protein [Bacteroidales bacterium]
MRFLGSKFANSLYKYFTTGHQRSVKAKKNIIASFFIRGASILISLLLVPLIINYINPSRYGVWITLSSIVAWFSFFDIGLTQGLRNRLAESIAKGDTSLAQNYVSTTYAILGAIFFLIWLLFLIVNNFLDWAIILNVSKDLKEEVTMLALIVFTYFCIQFVLKVINTIIIADQQPAKASFIDLLGQFISLLIIIVLIKTTDGSLIKLGIALCSAPIIILSLASVVLFNGEFRRFRPKISRVRITYAKNLFSLGVVFFVIQIAGIVQYQSANIIILQQFGSLEVTSYNIVYKYFGVLLMVSNIFILPFWSASTEAYVKQDFKWIKNGIRRYNQLNVILVIVSVFMLFFSETVYRVWLGEGTVNIGFPLSFWGFLYFNVVIFGLKYVTLLNSINALRIQFIACLFTPFLYIFVVFILIKFFNLKVHALYIASIVAHLNTFILAPLQYHLVINKKKKGIWTK